LFNFLSLCLISLVFCGDGIVSGIETCDLGDYSSSPGCINCQASKTGWKCTNSVPTFLDFATATPEVTSPLVYIAQDFAITNVLTYAPGQFGDPPPVNAGPWDEIFNFGNRNQLLRQNQGNQPSWIIHPGQNGRYRLYNLIGGPDLPWGFVNLTSGFLTCTSMLTFLSCLTILKNEVIFRIFFILII
jgi:hypothetical protein